MFQNDSSRDLTPRETSNFGGREQQYRSNNYQASQPKGLSAVSGCEISEAYQSQVSIPAANPSVMTLGNQASQYDSQYGGGTGERPHAQASRVIDDAPPQSNISRRGAGGIKASEQMSSMVQNDSQIQQMHQMMAQNSSQAQF